jgi:ketosteroid isomerase-like protein
MSEENVEIVRRAYEAYARGDLVAMFEDVDPEMITYRAVPDGATFHGPDGLIQAIADWVQGFDDFTMTPQEYIDANDHQVVVRVRHTAVGAQSGVPIQADFWLAHTLSAGKVTRIDMLASEDGAREAVGLSD